MSIIIRGNTTFGPRIITSGYDPDAQAFITAAGITDSTQESAINTLVTDLKTYGIWSKMLAVYPLVGGTSTSHSYNLKNVSQWQLTYSSGMTHGSLGMVTNGPGYANTGFKATTVGIGQNDVSVGIYMQAWSPNQTMVYGTYGNLTLYQGFPAVYPLLNSAIGPTYTPSTFDGFFQTSRNNSSNFSIKHKNNATSTISAASFALNSSDFWLCNANGWGNGPTITHNSYVSFFYIGTNLTSGEIDNMYTAVQAYQTTLGRQK